MRSAPAPAGARRSRHPPRSRPRSTGCAARCSRSRSRRPSRRCSTRQMAEAAAVAREFPNGEGRRSRGLHEVDAVRAVHRRALHELHARRAASIRRTRRSCSTTGTTPDSKIVGLSYLVWHPNGPPPGLRGSERPLAPAQRERRPVPQGRRRRRRRRSRRARSAPRSAATRRCSSTSGWCTRGSSPASRAVGARSAASARRSAGASAGRCTTRPRRASSNRRRRGYPSGDHAALRSSRLSQSSRTSSASCIHVPGPFTWAGSSRVNKPGSRSGKSTRLPQDHLAPTGRAQRGLEHREQREQRALAALFEARRVVRARVRRDSRRASLRAATHCLPCRAPARVPGRRSAPSTDRGRPSVTSRPGAAACP